MERIKERHQYLQNGPKVLNRRESIFACPSCGKPHVGRDFECECGKKSCGHPVSQPSGQKAFGCNECLSETVEDMSRLIELVENYKAAAERVDYDFKSDVLCIHFSSATDVRSTAHGEWLLEQRSAKTGDLVMVQINGLLGIIKMVKEMP